MKPRRNGLSLVIIVLVAFGSLAYTLVKDNRPALGLDLQGGISLVLAPAKKVDSDVLNQSIEIIRNRVDALGVGEPDITRQGTNILVEIPGVKDQEKARSVVGQTAELRFRPVLAAGIPPEDFVPPTTTTAKGATTTTADPTATTTTTIGRDRDPDNQARGRRARPDSDPARARPEIGRCRAAISAWTGRIDGRSRQDRDRPVRSRQWLLVRATRAHGQRQSAVRRDGRSQAQQADRDRARRSRDVGTDDQRDLVLRASRRSPATSLRAKRKDLALVLRYGALPVQLKEQSVETISATLGKDSLNAGMIAGAFGLALVLLYMLIYYRALGVVVLLGLTRLVRRCCGRSSATSGENNGLALSLAGATGIIVSIGVTVDSYVVFFERLKDEIKSGKSIRSSVDRGFTKAYRTIIAADVSSLIGAGLLYLPHGRPRPWFRLLPRPVHVARLVRGVLLHASDWSRSSRGAERSPKRKVSASPEGSPSTEEVRRDHSHRTNAASGRACITAKPTSTS